jgi:predicted GIY-YIG superfamily endonuclease
MRNSIFKPVMHRNFYDFEMEWRDLMVDYNVYVIELDKAVLGKWKFKESNPDYNETRPCVYVGQTSKDPEDRFSQHKAGMRSASLVRQYGVRLMPNLYEKYNVLPSRIKAENKEKWLVEKLRKRGYGVWWNKTHGGSAERNFQMMSNIRP